MWHSGGSRGRGDGGKGGNSGSNGGKTETSVTETVLAVAAAKETVVLEAMEANTALAVAGHQKLTAR